MKPSQSSSRILDLPLSPLDAAQTEAVVRLLIDVYYGEPQAGYRDEDRREMKGQLAEALSR